MEGLKTLDSLVEYGFFEPADLLAAQRLCALAEVEDADIALALALAFRSARNGDVLVDLADLPHAFLDREGSVYTLEAALWPTDRLAWARSVGAISSLAGSGNTPFVVEGTRIYVQRLYTAECSVVNDLVGRLSAGTVATGSGHEDPLAWRPGLVAKEGFDLAGTIEALMDSAANGQERNEEQITAIHSMVKDTFTVISGGPGTGKTVTVAKGLAVLLTGFYGSGVNREPVVKVAAFTGKAAARAKEALAAAAASIERDHGDLGLDTAAIRAIEPITIARLIGMGWGITSQPKVNAENPIEADVIVIDEVSMVSVADLATILAGTSPHTRVVLVGDHNQLPSIDAGQVMADLIGGATAAKADRAMVALKKNYRSERHINDLAQAVLDGDVERVWAGLHVVSPKDTTSLFSPKTHGAQGNRREVGGNEGDLGCFFVETDLAGPMTPERVGTGVADLMLAQRQYIRELVDQGQIKEAVTANTDAVVLAVHQRGYGSREHWNLAMDRWIHRLPAHRIRPDWVGRPVMITENDAHIGVVNGDVGIVVTSGEYGRSGKVALDGRVDDHGNHDLVDLNRLRALETVHAMTVHKSQGSEYATVVLLLPASLSPLLSRELVYTAITRAKKRVIIVGARDILNQAVTTPNRRASGLRERLTTALA